MSRPSRRSAPTTVFRTASRVGRHGREMALRTPGPDPRQVGRVADRPWLRMALAAMGAGGAILVILATSKYGGGLSSDSVSYIAAARNLLAGRGYTGLDGRPFTAWPPLYPAVLMLAAVVTPNIPQSAAYLQAAFFGMLVFTFGYTLSRTARSATLVLLGTATLVASVQLLTISVMVWSELLLLLLLLLFVLTLTRYLETIKTRWLVLACIAAALCSLQRYAGTIAIAVGVIVLLFAVRSGPVMKRLRLAAVFGLGSAAPLAVWFGRNYAASRLAARQPWQGDASPTSLFHHLVEAARLLTAWFTPGESMAQANATSVILVTALVAATMAFPLLHRRNRNATTLIAAVLLGVYVVMLCLVVGLFRLESLSEGRLLSPIYPLVMLLLFAELERSPDEIRRITGKPWVGPLVVACLMGFWLWPRAVSVRAQVRMWADKGAGGYNTTGMRESPTVRWLRDLPEDAPPLYSNAPDVIYILVHRNAVMSPRDSAELEATRRIEGPKLLVWFNAIGRRLMTPREIAGETKLNVVQALPDGIVCEFW